VRTLVDGRGVSEKLVDLRFDSIIRTLAGSARAAFFLPRSCPSSPGYETTMRFPAILPSPRNAPAPCG